MKTISKLSIIIFFVFSMNYVFAQVESVEHEAEKAPSIITNNDTLQINDSDYVFVFADEHPSFPGGDAARIKYFKDSIQYPKEAEEKGLEGSVYVTFVIEVDGSITHVRLLKGIGSGCDEEAIRATQDMPNWIAAKKNGENVRAQFNIPIRFVLPAPPRHPTEKEKKAMEKKKKKEAKAKKKAAKK